MIRHDDSHRRAREIREVRDDEEPRPRPVVGKRTLAQAWPQQVEATDMGIAARASRHAVQRRAEAEAPDGDAVHRAAAMGTRGSSAPLPFRDLIQRAFGRHDISHIQAHTGVEAAAGVQAMGARAFATGDRVAFAGAPDLHTAAHEAAHVVQQRAGVSLAGGVGATGDRYEVHADRVADLVVAGQSAEALLDQYAAGNAPATQRQAVQCAGAERAVTGRPDANAPYVDAPVGGGPTSVGMTTGAVIQVRVTGAQAQGVLKARVTAGTAFVRVGAAANALANECTLVGNVLYVEGLSSNETQAKTACEISILENDVEIQKLQPKVYDALELPIHAWKVTLSRDAGAYQGIAIQGEEVDMPRVIADVAATWAAAGIQVNLADTTAIHLQVDDDPDISKQVKAGLQGDGRFDMTARQIHLVFVPVYERFGLTFSRYSRDEAHPDQMTKDDARQGGYAAPMAIIGVNGYRDAQGAWGSRSAETEPIDGQRRPTTQADKDFHYQSLSSDTAHELGHVLSLPHIHNPKSATMLNNAESSYAFTNLMHSQVATPTCMLTGDAKIDDPKKLAARDRLDRSAHPRTQVGAMKSSADASYNTQRGALISDQYAQYARAHLASGRAFGQGVEDKISDAALEADFEAFAVEHDDAERGADELPAGPEVLRGRPYREGAQDLSRAVEEILHDGGVETEIYAPRVMQVLATSRASVEALTAAIAQVLDGKDRLAEELAGYIAEHSGEAV